MTRNEAILYIQGKTHLQPKQKEALIRKLFTHHCYFGHILSWIKVLNDFSSEEFHKLPYAERFGMIHTLGRILVERKSNVLFMELSEIFFENHLSFLELIIKRSRMESCRKIRALMIELFLGFSRNPAPGSTLEDYLPGLHHDDELICLKVLNFLFRNYGRKTLFLILKEIPEIEPPPSLLFHRTLNHFLCLQPEMDWAKALKEMLETLETRGPGGKKKIWPLYEETISSIERHQILSMNPAEKGFQTDTNKTPERIKAGSTLEHQENLTGFRLERFEKIGSKSEWR